MLFGCCGRLLSMSLQKLAKESAGDQFHAISELHLQINTEEHSMDDLGDILPSLQQLTFHDSLINSFRSV